MDAAPSLWPGASGRRQYITPAASVVGSLDVKPTGKIVPFFICDEQGCLCTWGGTGEWGGAGSQGEARNGTGVKHGAELGASQGRIRG